MTMPPDRSDTPLPEMSRLPRDVAPPPGLEDRVVAAMRQEKLLRPAGRAPWLQVAAALVFLAIGIGIGRWLLPQPVPPTPIVQFQPRFMLLLSGAAPVADDNARAREYGAWASAESKKGRYITGERLADEALLIERDRPSSRVPAEVQGFFVVSAAALEEAAAVARSSPHVRDGGRIVVRPIDTP
jgi:hypothetical protein